MSVCGILCNFATVRWMSFLSPGLKAASNEIDWN